MSANSATATTTAPEIDFAALAKGLNNVKKLAEKTAKEVDIPKEMNFHRAVFKIRVTSIINRDYRKIRGVITDVSGQYPKSQDITNHKGGVVGRVEKFPEAPEKDRIILIPNDLEDTQKNYKAHQDAGRTVIAADTFKDEFVYTKGMVVDFKCGDKLSVDGLKPFSEILISVSSSRYCTDPKKVTAENKPMIGVSNAIQQFEVVEEAFPRAVYDMFMRDPTAFQFPLPKPSQFLAEEEYKHHRVVEEANQSKALSGRMVYLPLLDTEDLIPLFGRGPGAQVRIDWAAKDAFTKKKAPKPGQKDKEEFFMWANGTVTLTQWENPQELLTQTTAQGGPLRQFRGELTVYSSILPFKINNLSLWELMAKPLFEQTRLIIQCNIGLYKTADNSLNKPEKEAESNVHFLDFKPQQFVHDFVGEIMTRIGVPCSRHYMETIASGGMQNLPTDHNPLSDSDQSFLNCSEWSKEGLLAFLRSQRAANFEFFAVLSNGIGKGAREHITATREWAAKKKDTTGKLALCEMLLWKDWTGKTDEWLTHLQQQLSTEASDLGFKLALNVANDNPSLKAAAVFSSGVAVYYAVDVKLRAAAEEKARKHPFKLDFAKPRNQQRMITDGVAGLKTLTLGAAASAPSFTTSAVSTTTTSDAVKSEQKSSAFTSSGRLEKLTIATTAKMDEDARQAEKRKQSDGDAANDSDETEEDDEQLGTQQLNKRAKQ